MSVNAHGDKHTWNLGLVRIVGSMKAEKCITLLEKKLSDYGLSLSRDIVASTTDGASLMKKVGRTISADHQLCLAHGIHLAVTSVLYSRNQQTDEEYQEHLEGESLLTSLICNKFVSISGSDDSDRSSDDDGDFEAFSLQGNENVELRPDYLPTIKKIRTAVKIFRKSPVRNDDVLQISSKRSLERSSAWFRMATQCGIACSICSRGLTMSKMQCRKH